MSTNKKIPVVPVPATLAPRPLRLRIDSPTEEVRIEVIPLVDVIFCILTFFILAALSFSRQQAISIDLPKASTGTAQGREILVVSLNEFGEVQVEQEPVITRGQFLQRLQTYRQQNPNGMMALYASPNASYNEVVQVLDLLRQVGGDRVALATLPGASQPTPGATPSLPPGTGVPGYVPAPGTNPVDPYGNLNPGNPANPVPPQIPGYPGLSVPGSPGINPGFPQPLPGQPGVSPGSSTIPSPGIPTSPRTNNAAPVPGQPGVSPGSSTTPAPSATTAPRTNNTAP